MSYYNNPTAAPVWNTRPTDRIPTLQPGFFRDASKMLSTRFQVIGRWVDATHGHWLDAQDMESLWADNIVDPMLNEIWQQHLAAKENWPNIASSLFLPERLSLFAGSDIGNEKVFLLWLDFVDEPEIWVYDSNGESRYKNFKEYLDAYIKDDISASANSWRV
jgi:hypothetical protein